jgi:hypothetical protein
MISMTLITAEKIWRQSTKTRKCLNQIEGALFEEEYAEQIASWRVKDGGAEEEREKKKDFRRREKTIRHSRMVQTELYNAVSPFLSGIIVVLTANSLVRLRSPKRHCVPSLLAWPPHGRSTFQPSLASSRLIWTSVWRMRGIWRPTTPARRNLWKTVGSSRTGDKPATRHTRN